MSNNKRRYFSPLNNFNTLNKSSSMPEMIIEKKNKRNQFPLLNDYNKFNTHIEDTMKNYKLNNQMNFVNEEEKKENLLSLKKYLSKEEIRYINKITHLNKSQENIINNKNYVFGDNLLKVSVNKNPRYLSPIHSLGILKINNKIFEDVVKINLERQRKRFDESIKNIEAYNMKFNVKMPKIRISTLNPKFDEEFPILDTPNNNNIIKRDSLRKKSSIKSLISSVKSSNDKIRFFSYYTYPNKNFPECREQFTLNIYGNNAYLTGGMCSIMKQINIWILNINSMIWKKLKLKNHTSNRFGHSCVIDKDRTRLFIFGGRAKMISQNNNLVFSNSGLYCGLEVFNFSNLSWSTPYFSAKNSPRLRRNHISELIGNYMIIHGGITENNEILNDVYIINIYYMNNLNISKDKDNDNNKDSDKWNNLIVTSNSKSPYLFGHSSTLVVPSNIQNHSKFSIYKFPENTFGYNKNGKLIPNEKETIKGWYIFGGKKKAESNFGITNDLYILKIGIKPCEWIKCDNTIGKKPCPRYFHSMNYYENNNFVIIHGGRNDSQSDTFALNDTFILNLADLNWIEVELFSQNDNFNVFSRCGHCSVIHDDKLIICGGMNNIHYLGSALLIVNLNGIYNMSFKKVNDDIISQINQKKIKNEDEN